MGQRPQRDQRERENVSGLAGRSYSLASDRPVVIPPVGRPVTSERALKFNL